MGKLFDGILDGAVQFGILLIILFFLGVISYGVFMLHIIAHTPH